MRKISVYENSLIFIIGDHGQTSLEVRVPESLNPEKKTQGLIPSGIKSSALPLVFVKRFGLKNHFDISDAPISLADIPETIRAELGLREDFSGSSMFKVGEAQMRPRRFRAHDVKLTDWKRQCFPPMYEFEVSGFS